jgi:hypothetical protein
VNLFPGGEEEVTITFAPPRSSSVPAGDIPFAVRIVSSEDTAGSAVVEGTIRVLPFDEVNAELVPRTIRLKRRGTTELAVDNAGNTSRSVQFFIEQEEDNLKVTVDPTVMDLTPGKATFANVTVRPRRTFWRGDPKTLPFQIAVLNEDRTGPPVYADGVVVQEQLLPKWLLKLLLALLAAALVLFILWQTVFKSVIESTAKDAVKPQVAAAAEAANQAKTAQQAADNAATKAAGSASQAAQSATRSGWFGRRARPGHTGRLPADLAGYRAAGAEQHDVRLLAPSPGSRRQATADHRRRVRELGRRHRHVQSPARQ